jgi:hypothetical protein
MNPYYSLVKIRGELNIIEVTPINTVRSSARIITSMMFEDEVYDLYQRLTDKS